LHRRRFRARGFTLVELATVVVIVGVLAAVTFVIYRRHVKTAHMAEATAISGDIRAGQNAYKSETGLYANVSGSMTKLYPAATPGAFATAWGAPCTTCTSLEAWKLINVHPNAPVMYGYATIAGVGAGTSPTGSSSGGSSFSGFLPAGTTVPPELAGIGPTEPFFATRAVGDTDGDGNQTIVMSYSHTNQIIVQSDAD
jgi:prepilin-type N-terminal cleavage/methylation domain-containing protein